MDALETLKATLDETKAKLDAKEQQLCWHARCNAVLLYVMLCSAMLCSVVQCVCDLGPLRQSSGSRPMSQPGGSSARTINTSF